MSLLPPEFHSALSHLLRALTTPDNTIRSQAEDQLNNDWIQNRPDVLLMGLVEQIHDSEDVGVSGMDLAEKEKGRRARKRVRSVNLTSSSLSVAVSSIVVNFVYCQFFFLNG